MPALADVDNPDEEANTETTLVTSAEVNSDNGGQTDEHVLVKMNKGNLTYGTGRCRLHLVIICLLSPSQLCLSSKKGLNLHQHRRRIAQTPRLHTDAKQRSTVVVRLRIFSLCPGMFHVCICSSWARLQVLSS